MISRGWSRIEEDCPPGMPDKLGETCATVALG